MIIIGFSNKTSRFIPRIFCKKLKHVAPIIKDGTDFIMLQFTRYSYVTQIPIKKRNIDILMAHGWVFVYLADIRPQVCKNAWTCVQFTKRIIGLKKWWIQTPDELYKELKKSKNVSSVIT